MYYKLNEDKTVSKVNTVEEWANELENYNNRTVGRDILEDGTLVSTIFLGLDHRFSAFDSPGDPIVFETMVFNNSEYDGYQRRYSDYNVALAAHELIVKEIKEKLH